MTRLPVVLSTVFVTLMVGAAATAVAGGPHEIVLVGRSFTPPAGPDDAAFAAIERLAAASRAAGRGRIHVLVQLDEVPDAAQRRALAADGLELGPYVPGRAWVAALDAGVATELLRRPGVRWFTPWDEELKVHPRLRAGDVASWARDDERPGWVMLFVELHADVDLQRGAAVVEAAGGVVMPPVRGLHGFTAWLPEERLEDLAAADDVLWLEEGPPPLTPTNDGARAGMRVDTVNQAPYGLEGDGVRLFVFDGGAVRSTHVTFDDGGGSRVTVFDGSAAADHPTHVAGTAAGDGSGSDGGRGRGVAPLADVLSAAYSQLLGTMLFWDNAGDIEADYATARGTYAADLGTNSIGSNTASNWYDCDREGDYGVSSALLDGIVRGDNATVGSAVAMTWANGNERTGRCQDLIPPYDPECQIVGRCGSNYRTTAPPSCAKNPIHVGAVYSDGGAMTSFSSWGPCDDGRLKPLVSAPGCETNRVTAETTIYSSLASSDSAYGGMCGTSMATPAVAGVVALLVEDWRDQGHGGAGARPLPALIRTWLAHTARDLGLDGPDYVYGYGLVDAAAAVDLVRADDGSLGGGSVGWGTGSVDQDDTDTYAVVVSPGDGELKVTLAWDDAAAAAFAGTALVNDLDLEVEAPGGAVSYPFSLDPGSPDSPATAAGANTRDNQEQVVVSSPAPGTWTVRVKGTTVPSGPQGYALAYTSSPATWDATGCTTATWGFETGADGFVLSGASRQAAPAAGHGAYSLRLGGAVDVTHDAYREVAIPLDAARAEWRFRWYMTTNEAGTSWGHGWDKFYAEVRDSSGNPVSVIDARSDGWTQNSWLGMVNIDLTPWAGQTVRLGFVALNDPVDFTTFWVDDVSVETCPEPTLGDFVFADGFETGLTPWSGQEP